MCAEAFYIPWIKEVCHIQEIFKNYWLAFGSKEHPAVPISGGIDPSVRFVGSHTNVLKSYFLFEKTLPLKGFFINQFCLKTSNLRQMDSQAPPLNKGSFYLCQGTLLPYEFLEAVTRNSLNYIIEAFKLSYSDIEIWICSKDFDLLKAVHRASDQLNILLDNLQERKYRHQFGVEGLIGRDFTIAVKNGKTGLFKSVAAIIVVEKDKKNIFVETAISPFSIIQQKYGFDHVLDCFPFFPRPVGNRDLIYKLQDCIISLTVLYSEGLRPSNAHNRNRLLKKYLYSLDSLRDSLKMSLSQLRELTSNFEQQFTLLSSDFTDKIIDDMTQLVKNEKNNI